MFLRFPTLAGLFLSIVANAESPMPSIAQANVSQVIEYDFSKMKVRFQPPPPPYPALARVAEIEGTVVVELIVDVNGVPKSTRAIEGPQQLRSTAEGYAFQWRFAPVYLNGSPQEARFKMTMPFRLNKPKAHVEKAVTEIIILDPDAKHLEQVLAAELNLNLKNLGVQLVTRAEADPSKDFHIRMEVGQSRTNPKVDSVYIRCSLLKDKADTFNIPGKPPTVWQRASTVANGKVNPDSLKALILPLLLNMIEQSRDKI